MQTPLTGNKYIVGWLTLRDGADETFDALVEPYVATCRTEPECRFFEMQRSRENPLTVVLFECFISEEAHAVHLTKPHFKAFWQELQAIALVGRFENVIAGSVNPDAYDFAAGRQI